MIRLKIISVRQVKCNFCHQWIQVQTYQTNSLYSCSNCLEKYRGGAEVFAQNGQPYRILFCPDSYPRGYSFKDASTQEQISLKNSDFGSWSQLQNVLGSSSFSQDQLQLIGSRISTINREYEQQAQNILDLMKELTRGKSQVFGSEKKQENINQSRLSLPKTNLHEQRSQDQLKHMQRQIDNFYLKIKDNGLLCPYDFYFQEEEIQRFRKGTEEGKPDRSFGTQLTNISYDDLFLNFKRSHGLKSNRSARSNDQTPTVSLRLTDQQSKNRIDAYLQTRYHSTSLHRILARNIKEAYERTNLQSKMIELVSFNIGSIDLLCYLSLFEGQHLTTIKLINVGLRDQHLKQLLEWMGNKKVQSLVLTGNKLTDTSLTLFLNRSLPFLREIYLGKNRIRKQRVKEDIVQIRSKFILYI